MPKDKPPTLPKESPCPPGLTACVAKYGILKEVWQRTKQQTPCRDSRLRAATALSQGDAMIEQARTSIRQHADTCQRRIVEIREVDPKGQNLIDELIHLEAYRDGLLTALEYIDDATQAQAGPRKFKTGDTVIITGTSNAANIGKRGTVTQVLDEIFNEVLLEGSTLRVFYEDKDLTSAD